MKTKNLILVVSIIAAAFLLFGCTGNQTPPTPMPGSDRDAHGCIGSAGYTWCEAKQKCLREWEENCTAAVTPGQPGSDRDAHGCIPSAGYTWCNVTQKCIRPWEENCTAAVKPQVPQEPATEADALNFCGRPNVAAIYTCGPYVRVVSSLLGGGSTFYQSGTFLTTCPVVGPDAMSEQCRLLLLGNNCVEQQVVCPVAPPLTNETSNQTLVGNDRDAHGCIGSAGYVWCEFKKKCLRSWEEQCMPQPA